MPPSPADRPSDPAERPAGPAEDGPPAAEPARWSARDRAEGVDGHARPPREGLGPATADLPDFPGDLAEGLGGRRRLSPRAVPYWRIDLALSVVPLAAVLTVVAVLVDAVPSVLRIGVPAVAWVGGLVAVAVVPPLRRRIWWYAIGEEEVDLRAGLFVITRTVVPMVRVQHVDLHRGPVSTRLGLAEIELHTAAGSVKIPALDRDEAERIRQQVAVLARVPDDL